MMNRCAAAFAILALSACATDPKPCPPSVPIVKTQTVVREIQRPCSVTKPDRPAKLAKPLPSDLEALAAALAGQLGLYEMAGGYADRAEAAIETCTAPTPR